MCFRGRDVVHDMSKMTFPKKGCQLNGLGSFSCHALCYSAQGLSALECVPIVLLGSESWCHACLQYVMSTSLHCTIWMCQLSLCYCRIISPCRLGGSGWWAKQCPESLSSNRKFQAWKASPSDKSKMQRALAALIMEKFAGSSGAGANDAAAIFGRSPAAGAIESSSESAAKVPKKTKKDKKQKKKKSASSSDTAATAAKKAKKAKKASKKGHTFVKSAWQGLELARLNYYPSSRRVSDYAGGTSSPCYVVNKKLKRESNLSHWDHRSNRQRL